MTLLVATAGCAGRKLPPSSAYQQGDRAGALEAQQELAEQAGRDQALENLRLGSMALAQGDEDLAETALRRAVATMTNFQADGEFRAMTGAESSKEWKGEPYEKMAAFLTLGTLLYADGDHGNALAMFKSSVLADTGTAEERYRSDFVPGWVMQALAYQAEGEDGNAEQFMHRGVDALWSRYTIDVLTEALGRATVEGASAEDLDRGKAVLLAAMSAGATAKPRNVQEAVRATLSYATDLAKQQRDTPAKERLTGLEQFKGRDFERAADVLPGLAESWAAEAAALPASVMAEGALFNTQMQSLLDHPPNVVILVESGRGPVKVRSGQYGEILTILPSRNRASEPIVALDGQTTQAVWMDSLTWQAQTRGGRGVDGFLKGKAVYKDASLITGYVLVRVADALAYSDHEELAAAAAIVGCVLMITSVVTNPAADVRQWDLAPDGWFLLAGDWSPGTHTLDLGSRTYTVHVPESGQVVGLVPALSPGGDKVIGEE